MKITEKKLNLAGATIYDENHGDLIRLGELINGSYDVLSCENEDGESKRGPLTPADLIGMDIRDKPTRDIIIENYNSNIEINIETYLNAEIKEYITVHIDTEVLREDTYDDNMEYIMDKVYDALRHITLSTEEEEELKDKLHIPVSAYSAD